MRRAFKRCLWVVAGVGLLIVLLVGSLWVAGNSDAGRGLIERLTYRLTGGQVQLSGLGGSFPSQLTLVRLQLSDRNGVWLTADRVSLRWSPLKLLEHRIQVDDLLVARIHMERTPVSDPHGGNASIPHIVVGRFAVDAVELGAPLVGTPATLSARGNLRLRSLQDANADVTAKRLDGDGDYALQGQLDPKRMDVSLVVHEPAGGPLENLLSLPGLGALSATMTLKGPRNAERVDLALSAGELRGQVQGSLDLTHTSADLDYSLAAPATTLRPDLSWNRLALRGNWHGPLSAPRADGHLEAEGLRLAATTRIARLDAAMSANGGKLDLRAVADGLEIPGPEPRFLSHDPLKIDATVLLNQAARPLQITAMHPLFTLHAHADTAATKGHGQHATLELSLPELAPFAALAAQDVAGNATIHAQLAHNREDDTVALEAGVALTGGAAPWMVLLGPHVDLKLSGTLSEQTIKLQNLRIAANALTLTAAGTAGRVAGAASAAAVKNIQSRWQLDVADLGRLSPDLAGNANVIGQLSGSPTAMALNADVTSRLSVRGSEMGTVEATVHARGLPTAPGGTLQMHGMVDGAPLNVDAAVDRRGNEFRLLVREAEWKSAHVDGDMTTDAALTQSHGQLRMHIAQLSDVDRLVGISIGGSVEGSLGFVPAHGTTQAHFDVQGKGLAVGPIAGDLHLEGTGQSDALALQLTGQLPKFYGAPASVTSAATLSIDAKSLRIASLSMAYRGETFRLLSPAQLSFAREVSIDDFKMGAQDAVFDLKGQLAPTLDLRASLLQVRPALVNVFAPQLLASGTIEARTRLRGSASNPTGAVRLDANNVRFADDAATGLPALDLHARAQLAGDTATLKGTLNAGPGSQMTISGTAPLSATGSLDLKIGGKLDVGLANPLLEARGLHATGQLTVDATVTGSSAAPVVGGGITLSDGSVRDYGRGINLSNINAEVVGNEAGLQIKSFDAKAATGSVKMSGTFGVLQPGMPVDLKVSAKNAQPVASSIVTANLDADLHIGGKARERIDVAGKIHVNRATIGIPNSLPPDVAVLDVRRRGQAAPVGDDKELIIGIDILVQAPQEILVQGRGLDAELGGEIRLTGTSDELLASGGFDLQRGSFTIAGNKLNFTQGRVGFDGAGLRKKIDPTLDFTAQTALASTTATLRITGVADAPRFEFSSSPPLPQDDIMAQLLFGENVAQLSALQVAQIGAALATLSGVGSGGLNPLAKLQKSLGLDRLTVGTNTTTTATGATENSGASIAAGRYVTKRIYIEGKQTTAGTSQVQVDVDLTKHLKLQTRLGNGTAVTQGTTPENDPGSSIGLSYQFEY